MEMQLIALYDSRRGNLMRRDFEALRLACPWKASEGGIHNFEIDLGSFGGHFGVIFSMWGDFVALSELVRCRQA